MSKQLEQRIADSVFAALESGEQFLWETAGSLAALAVKQGAGLDEVTSVVYTYASELRASSVKMVHDIGEIVKRVENSKQN